MPAFNYIETDIIISSTKKIHVILLFSPIENMKLYATIHLIIYRRQKKSMDKNTAKLSKNNVKIYVNVT
jgi:hypothetical protein